MTKLMISLQFEIEDIQLTREEFREKFKRNLGDLLFKLGWSWSYNLANTFGEIVKNFYDHANAQGVIAVTITENEAWWEATDCGPGDPEERSLEALIKEARSSKEKYANPKEDGNLGLGLGMIEGGLNGLRLCPEVVLSTWSLSTKDHFSYIGHLTFRP